ncbi:MAG TPA: DUF4382 domain-containing protein [Rubrivivax sp.]|nr:DUF4382 domain-containing protein [Rubrivivax sp.]HPO17843.1 DUF4382 domain-containing protein [Rubrivivax sp.]
MKFKTRALVAMAVGLQWLAGCGGGGAGAGGGIGGTGSPLGTLRMSLTDAPACGYDAVNITVERIRVHQSDAAAEHDGGWHDIVLQPARRVDLLSLTNGVLLELGEVALPAGKYTQLRLVLAGNGGAVPLANSVVPAGGGETALDTPSAQQSGLKLKANIDVPAGKVADFVLDFDACKSVVKRGNSGKYNLKPVVTVIPWLSDAGQRVVGYVGWSIASTATRVSVQDSGMPVKATMPDANGMFVLHPIPVGSYTLVISAPGRVTAVVTGVPVVDTGDTVVNSAALRIDPPPATLRPVSGVATPTDASVRALQTLSGGPVVEVAWAPVDALTGAFAFALSIEAPLRTSFAARGPASLGFSADAAAAGRYTIEAAGAGAVKTQPIDVNSAVAPLSFSLP